jgi:dynactin complex subunit
MSTKLKKGIKVKISAQGEYFNMLGTVKYIGPIDEKKNEGNFVGLEMDKPIGKNNGSYNNK